MVADRSTGGSQRQWVMRHTKLVEQRPVTAQYRHTVSPNMASVWVVTIQTTIDSTLSILVSTEHGTSEHLNQTVSTLHVTTGIGTVAQECQ